VAGVVAGVLRGRHPMNREVRVLWEKCEVCDATGYLTDDIDLDFKCAECNGHGGREVRFEFLEECCHRCGADCTDHSTEVYREVTGDE
jgi:hypothetical protein